MCPSLLQDAAWREQQRRLLSAHFGPREVESLAMNAVLPLDRDEGCVAGAPLLWVQQREMKVRRTSVHIETGYYGRQNARARFASRSTTLQCIEKQLLWQEELRPLQHFLALLARPNPLHECLQLQLHHTDQ